MNIAMFTNTYLPHVGGVARSVSTLAEELRALGHAVLVVAPEFPGCHASTAEVFRAPAIQRFNGSDFSVNLPLPQGLSHKLQAFYPDLIHSHHPFLLGDTALRAGRARMIPVVFTHHTFYEAYTHYVPLDSPVLKRLAAQLSTEYADLCDAVIAPSESVARMLRDRGVRRPVSVVPTGIDTAFFALGDGRAFRRTRGIPEDALVVGHLGRLAKEKNLPYLARVLAKVLSSNPRAWGLVVGQGPCTRELEDIFEHQRCRERVVMPGPCCGHELADAYGAMNVFVFASQSETQGLVLAEAMAAGVPVVALDAPGAREIVRDHRNGRLLDAAAGEVEFATIVVDLLRDADRRGSYGAQARSDAQMFTRRACALSMLDVYRPLVLDYRRQKREVGGFSVWDRALARLGTERDLLAEKTVASLAAVFGELVHHPSH